MNPAKLYLNELKNYVNLKYLLLNVTSFYELQWDNIQPAVKSLLYCLLFQRFTNQSYS